MSANEEEIAWDELDDDEKLEAFEILAEAHNQYQSLAITLFNCVTMWKTELQARDVFGDRHQAMASMHQRMHIIQAMMLPQFGVDMEQIEADAAFEDIISRIDDDD